MNKLLINIHKKKCQDCIIQIKEKIHYIVLDHEPLGISKISDKDNENSKNSKYILIYGNIYIKINLDIII